MSDLSVTAADVLPSRGAALQWGIAAVAITAGQFCYIQSNGQVNLAIANGSAPANGAAGVVVAVDSAAAGQPIRYCLADPNLIFGAAGSVGDVLFLSAANAGGCTKTQADIASSGDNTVVLAVCNLAGIAGTATICFQPIASPAVHA